MGRGRGRKAILAAVGVVVLPLLGAACGSESHPNEARPPISAEVAVNISERSIDASPSKVGVKRSNPAALSQNDVEQLQSDRKAPLVVTFTTANATTTDTVLEIHGPVDERSSPIIAGGNDRFKVGLPNGNYRLEAADIPGATPASFEVGPLRDSSQNDLSLP